MSSEIIKNILIAGSGSFIGGAARYLISLAMKNVGKGFPWATLAVNLAGCLLIGVLWGLFSRTSEEEGTITVIRPERPVEVGRMEKDTAKLTRLYQEGYEIAEKYIKNK